MALEENLGSTALIAPSSVLFSIVMLTLHTCKAFVNSNSCYIQMYMIWIEWSELINLLLWHFSFYLSTRDNSGASCTLVHKSFVKIVHIPAYHSIISVQQNYDLNIVGSISNFCSNRLKCSEVFKSDEDEEKKLYWTKLYLMKSVYPVQEQVSKAKLFKGMHSKPHRRSSWWLSCILIWIKKFFEADHHA